MSKNDPRSSNAPFGNCAACHGRGMTTSHSVDSRGETTGINGSLCDVCKGSGRGPGSDQRDLVIRKLEDHIMAKDEEMAALKTALNKRPAEDDRLNAIVVRYRTALQAIEAWGSHQFRPGDASSGWENQCSVVTPDHMRHCGHPPERHPLARDLAVYAQKTLDDGRAPGSTPCAGSGAVEIGEAYRALVLQPSPLDDVNLPSTGRETSDAQTKKCVTCGNILAASYAPDRCSACQRSGEASIDIARICEDAKVFAETCGFARDGSVAANLRALLLRVHEEGRRSEAAYPYPTSDDFVSAPRSAEAAQSAHWRQRYEEAMQGQATWRGKHAALERELRTAEARLTFDDAINVVEEKYAEYDKAEMFSGARACEAVIVALKAARIRERDQPCTPSPSSSGSSSPDASSRTASPTGGGAPATATTGPNAGLAQTDIDRASAIADGIGEAYARGYAKTWLFGAVVDAAQGARREERASLDASKAEFEALRRVVDSKETFVGVDRGKCKEGGCERAPIDMTGYCGDHPLDHAPGCLTPGPSCAAKGGGCIVATPSSSPDPELAALRRLAVVAEMHHRYRPSSWLSLGDAIAAWRAVAPFTSSVPKEKP